MLQSFYLKQINVVITRIVSKYDDGEEWCKSVVGWKDLWKQYTEKCENLKAKVRIPRFLLAARLCTVCQVGSLSRKIRKFFLSFWKSILRYWKFESTFYLFERASWSSQPVVQEEKVQMENDGGEDAAAESPEAGVDVPVEEADNQ